MNLHRLIRTGRIWICLGLLGIVFGFSGCGAEDDDAQNTSAKPWNSPEGYQNGMLPSTMMSH